MAGGDSFTGTGTGADNERVAKRKARHSEAQELQSRKLQEALDSLRRSLVADGLVDRENEETLKRSLERELEDIENLLVKLDQDKGDFREDATETGAELADLRDQLFRKSGKDWDLLIKPLLDDNENTIFDNAGRN